MRFEQGLEYWNDGSNGVMDIASRRFETVQTVKTVEANKEPRRKQRVSKNIADYLPDVTPERFLSGVQFRPRLDSR